MPLRVATEILIIKTTHRHVPVNMSNDDSTRVVAANKKMCESQPAADKRKFGQSTALPNVMGLIGAVIVVLALTVTLGFYGGALAPQKLLLLGLL